MQKVSGLESVSAATLAAEVAIPSPANFFSGWERGELRRLLVLERLQDPGNLVRRACALCWLLIWLLLWCSCCCCEGRGVHLVVCW